MYIVRWSKLAMDELAAIWLTSNSIEREAVTAATAEIDFVLKQTPSKVGESRTRSRRIAFEPPLAFTFDVNEANNSVKVAHVWQF
jgi:hypothetical protein